MQIVVGYCYRGRGEGTMGRVAVGTVRWENGRAWESSKSGFWRLVRAVWI